jgi:hypothetical protein
MPISLSLLIKVGGFSMRAMAVWDTLTPAASVSCVSFIAVLEAENNSFMFIIPP